MILKLILTTASLLIIIQNVQTEESVCTIFGNKLLNRVSEKFLSLSVDPAVLLTGLNLSESTLNLAKHFAPAYVRLAGPSTKFVKYVDNESERSGELNSDPNGSILLNPPMWFGINEWLASANLTPIFGLNDVDTTNGMWNPKSTLALFELSDKLNISGYWQLGFDCSNKTPLQYKQDLSILKHVLEAFPDKANRWKIIGSDISRCLCSESPEVTKKHLQDLEGTVTAVLWEPASEVSSQKDMSSKLLSLPKPAPSLWTTSPKANLPFSFAAALSWAQTVGETAKQGYEVILRQPRLHEFYIETSSYWFSLLHKQLMGRVVLETVSSSPGVVYAHCTKNQNSYVRRGAMTVMVVNNKTENFTALIRITNPKIQTIEIQSYILTSTDEVKSYETYLNDELLTPSLLKNKSITFIPIIRRAKTSKSVGLEVPPKSIGFFVMPGAQIPICIQEEKEIELLLREIGKTQQENPLPKKEIQQVSERASFVTLEDVQKNLENEMKFDEKYFRFLKKETPKLKEVREKLLESRNKNKFEEPIKPEVRNFLLERAKLSNLKKKVEEGSLSDVFKPFKLPPPAEPKKLLTNPLSNSLTNKKIQANELELSSKEVQKILRDRAKKKAAKKNIVFTSAELDELMNRATNKYRLRLKRDLRERMKEREEKFKILMDRLRRPKKKTEEKSGETLKDRLEKLRRMNKRDINMDMLKIKSNAQEPLAFKSFKMKHRKIGLLNKNAEDTEEMLDTDVDNEDISEDEELPKNTKVSKLKPLKNKSRKSSSYEHINVDDFPCLEDFAKEHVTATKSSKKPKSDEDVTIKSEIARLSDYFKDPEDVHEKEDGIFLFSEEEFDHLFRKRRETPFSTEEVKKYNILIKKELNLLKDILNKQQQKQEVKKLLRALKKFETQYSKNNVKPLVKYMDILGKPFKDTQELIRPGALYHTLKEMKTKLQENINNTNEVTKNMLSLMKLDSSKEKIKIIEDILLLPKTLMKKGTENKTIKHITKRDSNDNLIKKFGKYTPQTIHIKKWIPSDMLNLARKSKIRRQPHVIIKRNINSENTDNEFDSIFNEIEKNVKFVKPMLDTEEGDYKIILPNKKAIDIKENHGDTSIRFLKSDRGSDEKHSDQTGSTTEEAVFYTYNDDVVKKLQSDNDTSEATTRVKKVKTAANSRQHIQRIIRKTEDNFATNVFRNISGWFQNFGKKVEGYIKYIF